MRRRLSPAALQRLGSDAIPTQAARLTYTPEGVMHDARRPGLRGRGSGVSAGG